MDHDVLEGQQGALQRFGQLVMVTLLVVGHCVLSCVHRLARCSSNLAEGRRGQELRLPCEFSCLIWGEAVREDGLVDEVGEFGTSAGRWGDFNVVGVESEFCALDAVCRVRELLFGQFDAQAKDFIQVSESPASGLTVRRGLDASEVVYVVHGCDGQQSSAQAR